ncbi:unnamed protein product, partial [marine sediment metagenome]
AAETRRQLRLLEPDESEHVYELAGIHLTLGSVYLVTEKFDQCRVEYETSVEMNEQLVEDYPNEIDYIYDLGQGYIALLQLSLETNDRREEHWLDLAEETFERLVEQAPLHVEIRERLLEIVAYRAQIQFGEGKFEEAAQRWQRVVELNTYADDDLFYRFQRDYCRGKGGDHQAAAATASEMADTADGEGELLANAALLIAVAAIAVESDETLSGEERQSAAERYTAEGIDMLRGVLKTDYFSQPDILNQFESNPDAAPLFRHPDYDGLWSEEGGQ